MTSAQRTFYARTQHCGLCGQPDGYCTTCNGRCGCADMHPAADPDAVDRYTAPTIDDVPLFEVP